MNSCKRTLLFIDYLPTGFKRYAESIIKEIRDISNQFYFVAIYMDGPHMDSLESFDEIICASSFDYDPVKIFETYNPDGIVLFAHRFFDYMFTLEAHKRKIPAFNFQHGLYMDNTVISKLSKTSALPLIRRKKDQIKLYSKCIYYMNQKKLNTTVAMISDLMRQHDLYEVVNKRLGKSCNADISFIYGEYWKRYYREQYKETETDFRIIGYPELEGSLRKSDDVLQNDLPSVCYLAQTSVEDGIIEENILQSFLSALKTELIGFNLILKLHPRSDIALYESLIDNSDNVLIWDYPEFPECDCYIGHESTVVARALYITNKTMVYRLCEDRISPFENFTEFKCTDKTGFSEQLSQMLKASDKVDVSGDLKSYVYKNPLGALKETAQIICDNV